MIDCAQSSSISRCAGTFGPRKWWSLNSNSAAYAVVVPATAAPATAIAAPRAAGAPVAARPSVTACSLW